MDSYKSYKNKNQTRNIYSLLFINLFINLGVDIHLPSMLIIQKDLNLSIFEVQQIFIVYLVGAAISRLVFGLILNHISTKKLLIFSLVIQTISQIFCIFASNLITLCICRLIQSIGAGISVIILYFIAKNSNDKYRIGYLNILESTYLLAFFIAPIIGVYFLTQYGWRYNFLFIAIAFFVTMIFIWYFFSESENIKKDDIKFFQNISIKHFICKNTINNGVLSGFIAAVYLVLVLNSPNILMQIYHLSEVHYTAIQSLSITLNILATLFVNSYLGKSKIILLIGIFIFLLLLLISISIIMKPFLICIIIALFLINLSIPFLLSSYTSNALGDEERYYGYKASTVSILRTIINAISLVMVNSFSMGILNNTFTTVVILCAISLVIIAKNIMQYK